MQPSAQRSSRGQQGQKLPASAVKGCSGVCLSSSLLLLRAAGRPRFQLVDVLHRTLEGSLPTLAHSHTHTLTYMVAGEHFLKSVQRLTAPGSAMPPAYELAELDDSESGSESSSQVDVDCMADLFQVCCGVFCCLWILFITVGSEVVAWNRQASCSGKEGDGRIQWNAVLPPETATAMRLGIPSLLWHQVDVFNGSTADGQKLGYWSNVDLFLGNVQPRGRIKDTVSSHVSVLLID